MRILRLLLTKKCNKTCPLCCNKNYDLKALPQVRTFGGYSLICLTGGEPMLFPDKILSTVERIRKETDAPIYLYTALVADATKALEVLRRINGMTLTLHDRDDVMPFIRFNRALQRTGLYYPRSMRLNIFKGVPLQYFQPNVPLHYWVVKKNVVWVKDCPFPQNEEFMRL